MIGRCEGVCGRKGGRFGGLGTGAFGSVVLGHVGFVRWSLGVMIHSVHLGLSGVSGAGRGAGARPWRVDRAGTGGHGGPPGQGQRSPSAGQRFPRVSGTENLSLLAHVQQRRGGCPGELPEGDGGQGGDSGRD